MKINEDKSVVLNEDEAMIFGASLQGVLQGYNMKLEEGHYFPKDEREFINKVKSMVERLEDNDII